MWTENLAAIDLETKLLLQASVLRAADALLARFLAGTYAAR